MPVEVFNINICSFITIFTCKSIKKVKDTRIVATWSCV